jgi:hypothetical protein
VKEFYATLTQRSLTMNRLSLTLVTFLAAAPALTAQAAPNACGLLTKAEVDQLINRGKAVSGTPTAIASAGGKGSVCAYATNAIVAIYAGPNSHANFEWILKRYKITEKDKKPVSGIGDKAYMFYPRTNNPVDYGPHLVMTVGTYTVVAQIAAHKSEVTEFTKIHCSQPDLSARDKEDCAKTLADKDEPMEAVWPAVQALGKAVAAKVRAGKF